MEGYCRDLVMALGISTVRLCRKVLPDHDHDESHS